MLGAGSIVLDPDFASYRDSLASSIGDLGPDGFPVALPQKAVPERALLREALRQKAILQRAVAMGGRMPRARLVLLAALLLGSSAALAILASSSSGMSSAVTHANGQASGQDPGDTSRASTRRPMVPLPITALLPKKQDHGIILPMMPVGSPGGTARKPRRTHSVTPSPTPTPTSPSPMPTSASPSPTSPSPTSTIPQPTPTVTP
jgi:hypothetical protein